LSEFTGPVLPPDFENTGVEPCLVYSDEEPDTLHPYVVYGRNVKIMPTRSRAEYTSIHVGNIVIGFVIEKGKDGKPFRNVFVAKVISRHVKKRAHVIIRLQAPTDAIYSFQGAYVEIHGNRLVAPQNHILYISKTIQINGIPGVSPGHSLGLIAVHEEDFCLTFGSVVTLFKTNSSWQCKCIVLGFVYEVSNYRAILYVDAVDDRSSSSALSVDRLGLIQFGVLAKTIRSSKLPVQEFDMLDPALSTAVVNISKKAEYYIGRHCWYQKEVTIKRVLNDAMTVRLAAIQKDAKIITTFFDTNAPTTKMNPMPSTPHSIAVLDPTSPVYDTLELAR